MSLLVYFTIIVISLFSVAVTVSTHFVSFVVISVVLCGCFKAMSFVIIFIP